jgi:hypothetical protein
VPDIDSTDIFKLVADLGEAPQNVGEYVAKALGVTSLKVKQTWAAKVGRGIHPSLPSAIDYSIKGASGRFGTGRSYIEAEIGFNKGRFAGPLGNISEYGSLYHPARGFGLASLQENEADLEAGIAFAVEAAMSRVNL